MLSRKRSRGMRHQHSWKAYEENAWGADEYHPISKSGSYLTSNERGMGYTIVDSLDSLLLMGFDEEYERARDWVKDELSFDVPGKVNGFETIIRILGGLLSAYYLTSTHTNPVYHDDSSLFLEKALDLSDRLLPLFDTPSGIPYSFIDLAARKAYPDADNGGMSSLAEAGTLQLEFKYLSEISGNPMYGEKAEHVMMLLDKQMPAEGVAPVLLNPQTGQFALFDIRLGSRGDSYYEYLLKQWIQTNRTEPVYRKMYDRSMKGIEQVLMNRSAKQGLVFTHELGPQRGRDGIPQWMIRPKQDHLVCFLGGSMLLGVASAYPNNQPVWSQLTPSQKIDYAAGKGLIETCVNTYEGNPTGLGAEIVMFRSPAESKAHKGNLDWYIKHGLQDEPILDGRNILRPETIESLFLAYRLTGDQIYRDQGWRMFKAFERYCRLPGGGYAGIADVENGVQVERLDKMETFWLSETLKYFYLLFSDGQTVPLDQNVFNTEAHILPIFTPKGVSDFASSV
ncbi:hypothetical protein FFLO_04735 [Filobasidium floriforme]|uniref:alpha-1,2-Mannosidase n=1 Tax=Filobasidium floriforme TaxID=5210 RepID=A0A8K0JIA8_9TREE|nr:hypothetical protein FFLO_04735 [Filobasidium floriforme]